MESISSKQKFWWTVQGFWSAVDRFLWFVAGAFAGYLWMAKAYGLF